MEGEDDSSTVLVFQLYMTALAVNFAKTHSLQSEQDLPAREQRQLHKVRATTS